jgi:hypothetical protein
MKRNLGVFLLLGWGMMSLTGYASGLPSVDDQVKSLAQRYTQVEAQLDRSVHYVKKENSDGATTVEQAWLNGAGDPIKVAVERADSSGRELTQYFEPDFFENADVGMFMLTRKETPLPGGGTQVDESRKYFGRPPEFAIGELIRELRKSARFKAGESTDTVHVPNVVVDVVKRPTDQRSDDESQKAESEFFSKPLRIAEALKKAGPPVVDPFANVKGDSGNFRVIHRTVSPDGRYAIALGFARAQINWDDFVEKTNLMTGEPEKRSENTYTAMGEEDVRNYVVDLAEQKILGETGCVYFSTDPGPRPGHVSCQIRWSPDSTKFVQEWEQRSFTEAVAGQFASGPKRVRVVDLEKEVEKKTFSVVKRPQPSGALRMDVDRVSNEGEILLKVFVVAESGYGEDLFTLSERLRLRQTAGGLRLETINIHRLPKEE